MTQSSRLLVAIAASQMLAACQGAPAPTASPSAAPAVHSRTGGVAARRPVTPSEFHARNSMDWVGAAHNRLMDDLRAEIRRSRPKDLCRVIEQLVVDGALDPRAGARLSSDQRRRARKDALDQVGCRRNAGARSTSGFLRATPGLSLAGNASGMTQEFTLSGDAWALVDQVTAAGESAATPGDLATELSAITSQAQGLTADEASVVEAMASVSLSSFEYWSQNGQAMAEEMATAYGDCVATGGGDSCYLAMSHSRVMQPSPATIRLATYTPKRAMCTIDVGTIWRGDKWGAGAGLAIGLRTGVQGAIIGIFAGAAGGSGLASLYELGKFIYCAYK